MQLLNCWKIKKCGRQRGGKKVNELGECIASKGKVGHSVAGHSLELCAVTKSKALMLKKSNFVHSVKFMKSITDQGAIWEK